MKMTEANSWNGATSIELVQRCYGHAGKGEWDKASALLADDFAFHEPPSLDYGGVWRGNDAMQRLVQFLMEYWADPDIKVEHLIGDDNHCIVLMKLSVTSKKTGRRFTQDVVEVLRIANGRISELRVHYFDTAELALDTGSIARLSEAREAV
jgi:ketosteroid isomerase-like protein